MTRNERGQSLVEILFTLSILGCVATTGLAVMNHARRVYALSAGTAELRALFQRVRMIAIVRDCNVAIRFRPAEGDGWSWSVYEDGDGDGVRNDDITRGVDRLIEKPRLFQHPPVRIGVPAGAVPDPTAPGQLLSLRLPVRFGTSLLCSFSRQGEATNGSVVITDGVRARIIRVHGTTGRIDVYRWDGKKWRVGE